MPLAFAGTGGLKVRLFRDTDSDNTKPCADVTCDTFLCDASDSLTASAAANGGFAAIVEPADAAAPFPSRVTVGLSLVTAVKVTSPSTKYSSPAE